MEQINECHWKSTRSAGGRNRPSASLGTHPGVRPGRKSGETAWCVVHVTRPCEYRGPHWPRYLHDRPSDTRPSRVTLPVRRKPQDRACGSFSVGEIANKTSSRSAVDPKVRHAQSIVLFLGQGLATQRKGLAVGPKPARALESSPMIRLRGRLRSTMTGPMSVVSAIP
jgi:hypothetical protein